MEPTEEYTSVVEPMKTKEEAAAYVANTIDQGFAAVCLGLGVQVGLFDVLAGMDGPATVEEIARAGDYKEKYVKELLALMVYHKLLCYDERREKFWLPETHKECLTGVTSPLLAFVPLLTLPFHDLVACFKKNGPNGYINDDPVIYEQLERGNKLEYTLDFMERIILSKEPDLVNRLDEGMMVLDIGCARGQLIMTLSKRFPRSEFVGLDMNSKTIQRAKEKAEAEKLSHVNFVAMDIYKMPTDWKGKFDVIMSKHTIHDLPYVQKGLKEVLRVLSPGGRFLLLEPAGHSNIVGNIDDPAVMFRQACSLLYCVPGSLYFENGDGIGMTWGQEQMKLDLQKAGFDVTYENNISPSERLVISKPAANKP